MTKKRIAMSERWLEKNPDDPDVSRMIFYLAEAYVGIDKDKAIDLYQQRLSYGGDSREKYISLLNMANLTERLEHKLTYWHIAQEMDPHRLEAFYDMFMYYHKCNQHRKAVGVYYMAPTSRIPPHGTLFVRQHIYDYLFDLNASVDFFYIAEYKKAFELGLALKTRKSYPPSEEALIDRNMKCFAEKYAPGPSRGAVPLNLESPLPAYLVIDNFYENPYEVRERALGLAYPVKGNYPGARTESMATLEDKKKFESILGRSITHWPAQYNGSFQYTTKSHTSWIHRDPTDFSVVVYLTPNPPVNGGTVLYRHKRTGLERTKSGADEVQLNSDGNDESLWEVVDRIGNKFNRAIIFQGANSHKSDMYFGDDINTGRLFQTFFFNVEGRKY